MAIIRVPSDRILLSSRLTVAFGVADFALIQSDSAMVEEAWVMATSEDRHHLEKHGYVILRGVYNSDEVASLRGQAEHAIEESGGAPSDVLSERHLRWLMKDHRLTSAAKVLLGEPCIYFGLSAVTVGDPGEIRHMHVDRKGDVDNPALAQSRSDPATTDWPVVRFGIYLQDHASHSGGLKVRQGSHHQFLPSVRNMARLLRGRLNRRGVPVGRLVNLDSRPGDVVAFNLATHHTGGASRLKMLPGLTLPVFLERHLPSWLFLPGLGDRHVVFIDFGTPSPHLNGYILNRAIEPNLSAHWKRARFDEPELRALIEEDGIKVDTSGLEAFRSQSQAERESRSSTVSARRRR